MRCPKCHYITFDGGERCRNCGYEFSLSVAAAPVDLPIQQADAPEGPLADLRLAEDTGVRVFDGALQGTRAADVDTVSPAAPAPSGLDLPLFEHGDDAPLVTPPAVPRAPLSVRRDPVIVPRPRVHPPDLPEEGQLDLDSDEPDAVEDTARASRAHGPAPHPAAAPRGSIAGVAPRLFAGILDAAIAAAIDATVVYLTLRLLGLEPAQIRTLPLVPLVAFLLLLNGGYFVIFTAAGGQTIGKMAAGIRVVSHGSRVPFGTAVLRAAAYFVALVPAGLGLVPALFDSERRALHDRVADTRVVKA